MHPLLRMLKTTTYLDERIEQMPGNIEDINILLCHSPPQCVTNCPTWLVL
jgi:hypothetical protein